ncbi:MAG: hypothetical protein HY014_08135 [Acidobacteria bacterium]|nr:hypothetical protein [Acidobacteriota bacterium]MBI3488120.1 hypothetical protein [Acidobacteriota bacterium]
MKALRALPLVCIMAGAWAGEPESFAPWTEAADRFLAQPWRTSHYSGAGAKAKLTQAMPGPEACFETLLDALPPAARWSELPALTRARLQPGLPRTSAEVLAWTDRRLLHLWALRLNQPGSEGEIRATLDDLRTVRWLVARGGITTSPDARLDYSFADRLGALDRILRPDLQPGGARLSEADVFRNALIEARETPQQRVIRAIGPTAYERLRAVASARREAPGVGRETDPAAEAWLEYGPLPAVAEEAFGEALGADVALPLEVPDLVQALGSEGARTLVQEALAASAPLNWSRAGATAPAVARWLAEGRLEAPPDWSTDFLQQLLASWEAPTGPRAEAGLALIAALEARSAKERAPGDEESALGLGPERALCLLACGRGAEAAQVFEKAKAFPDSIPAAVEAEHPRAVAECLMRLLPHEPVQGGHQGGHQGGAWARMQAQAHRAGLDAEALKVLVDHRESIQAEAESLILKAQLDAGQTEAAAATLQDIARRPYDSEGYTPTARRTEALLQLLRLGDEARRPAWSQLALDRLGALMRHWTTVKAGCSDGGEPWAKLPGLLAARGRLDLALSAAKLNVRWSLANAGIGEVFLMPEQERLAYVLRGPASAMAGLLQVWALQKKPKAILDDLNGNPHWPARTLEAVADYADPSFPETLRKSIGATVAEALEALGRKKEAQRLRDFKPGGFQTALATYLASGRGAALSAADRDLLRMLVVNEVEDDASLDLVRMAGAMERADLPPEAWRAVEPRFLLKAAARRIDGWMKDGPPVPMPPVQRLRTEFVATATALGPVRDALLLNVPDGY